MPTKIEWCNSADGLRGETWNPITGCSPVSAGCERCFAKRMALRLQRMGQPRYRDGFAVRFHPEALGEPLRWRKPRRCFVVSMGDLFHDDVTDKQIASVFGVMAACPAHQFMILTKRAERMRRWFRWYEGSSGAGASSFTAVFHANEATEHRLHSRFAKARDADPAWPLPNVWLGCTAENQATADERIPLLLDTPAAVRFVSVEPMLEAIDIGDPIVKHSMKLIEQGDSETPNIDLVICGGETGPRARPMQLNWVRSLRDQCVEAGVPFFLKAWLENGKRVSMPKLDGRVWDQMPEVRNG